jgi:hypothetical protein
MSFLSEPITVTPPAGLVEVHPQLHPNALGCSPLLTHLVFGASI